MKLDELEMAAALNKPVDSTTNNLLTQLNYTIANITPEHNKDNPKRELRADEKVRAQLEAAGIDLGNFIEATPIKEGTDVSLVKISKDQEKQLVRGVERVIDLVKTASLQPTDALVKVAKEFDFAPEEVRRVSEAYNISRSLANHKEKQGEARCEPFDLAHADLAIKHLYPADIKSQGQEKAAHILKMRPQIDLMRPVNYIEKVASSETLSKDGFKELVKVAGAEDVPQRPDQLALAMEKQAHRQKHILSQAEEGHSRAKFAMLDSLTKAASAIRSSEAPFERIEQALVAKYGDGAVKLADLLYSTAKQASFKGKRATSFGPVIENFGAEPFRSIDQFVKASADFKSATEKFASLKKQAAQEGDWVSNFFEKQALGVNDVMNRWQQGMNTSNEPLYQQELGRAVSKIHDPKYTNELRRIRTQSMITDWLANDEVIKPLSSSPDGVERVLTAYNELAAVSPQAADNPVLARSFVRRMIQMNEQDPFALDQMINVGVNLDRSQNAEQALTPQIAAMGADPKALAAQSNPYMYRQKPTNLTGVLRGMATGKNTAGFTDPALDLDYRKYETDKERNKLTQKRDDKKDQLETSKFDYDKSRNKQMDAINFPNTLAELGTRYSTLRDNAGKDPRFQEQFSALAAQNPQWTPADRAKQEQQRLTEYTPQYVDGAQKDLNSILGKK
jgi:hypothetical protein